MTYIYWPRQSILALKEGMPLAWGLDQDQIGTDRAQPTITTDRPAIFESRAKLKLLYPIAAVAEPRSSIVGGDGLERLRDGLL